MANPDRRRAVQGWVYLIHLDRPVTDHAQHYIGWASDVEARYQQHVSGQGGRLLAVAASRGIPFRVVRTWPGTRADERRMKRQHHHARYCPDCQKGVPHA